jgi:hypothetical protein
MPKVCLSVAVALCFALALSACGGSTKTASSTAQSSSTGLAGSTSTDAAQQQVAPPAHLAPGVVVQIGHTAIDKHALDYWMKETTGGDFYNSVKVTPPKDLVTEPMNYSRCATEVKAMEAKRLPTGPPLKRTTAVICHYLYIDVVRQALGELIGALRNIAQAAELGISVSNAEVARKFKKVRAEGFPTEALLARYLSERNSTLSVELFLVRQELVNARLLDHLKGKGEAAYASMTKRSTAKWLQMTRCRAGYVSEGCPGYKEPAKNEPALSQLIEEIIGIA